MNLDGELRLDLAPDVAGLAAVDALVFVAAQVRDDERRLHPVAVLAVWREEDVAVLQISFHQLVPDRTLERHRSRHIREDLARRRVKVREVLELKLK